MTWRSIESAPRDGTPVLVYYEFRACQASDVETGCAVAFWLPRTGTWEVFTGGGDFESDTLWATPTHWQSPPEAPK